MPLTRRRSDNIEREMAKRKGNRANRPPRPKKTGAGGTTWLYGIHAVAAALANPTRVRHRLIATEDGAERLAALGGQPEIVDRRSLEELLPPGAVHQGVALSIGPLAAISVEEIGDRGAAAERAVVIVLDRVSDPRNVGAVTSLGGRLWCVRRGDAGPAFATLWRRARQIGVGWPRDRAAGPRRQPGPRAGRLEGTLPIRFTPTPTRARMGANRI